MKDIVLQTPRLLLTEITSADEDFLWSYMQFESFYLHRAIALPTRAWMHEQVENYVLDQRKEPRLNYYFLAALKGGAKVGLQSIRINPNNIAEAEIGTSIHHDHWQRGYSTEAGRAVIDFGFNKLALHKIFAHATEDNVASHRVLTKLRFKDCGRVIEPKEIRGSFPHAHRYELQK